MKLYIRQKVFSWKDKFKVFDEAGNDKYYVEVSGREYQILYASVTYFHLREGMQVSIIIPADNNDATWAAVEAAL